jgi:2-polyprenyl-3-methyl-5-hydroxy-6-metoxy-1,4-benzoquinol methylase
VASEPTKPAAETAGKAAAISYRDRIYGSYVSAFKGRLAPDELRAAFAKHARVFDHLVGPYVSPKTAMLEVGCGSGALLFWARERGLARADGFDLSAEQIEVARTLDLPAEVASYRDFLPSREGVYDLVVGMDVVEHLTRDEVFEFLDLARAALKPGGRVLFTTPNGAGLRYGPVRYGDLTHETVFTPQTISLALRLSGFDDVRVREIAPPPVSPRARVRGLLWRLVRLWPLVVDVVETGGAAGVYTRNMAVVATRAEGHGERGRA